MPAISAFQLEESWPWGGATFSLRLFYTQTWTDTDGKVHLQGDPGAGSPCKICPGTIAGTTATVLSFDHSPTVTSPDRPRVRVNGALFDADGRFRKMLFESWQVPNDTDPLTWKFWSVWNRGKVARLADKYLNRTQIYALLGEFIGAVLPGSDVVLGALFLSAAPLDAARPEALSTSDARVALETGIDTLVSGEGTTVLSALVAETSPIDLVAAGNGITGRLFVMNRIAGVSFEVWSENGADAGDFKWFLY